MSRLRAMSNAFAWSERDSYWSAKGSAWKKSRRFAASAVRRRCDDASTSRSAFLRRSTVLASAGPTPRSTSRLLRTQGLAARTSPLASCPGDPNTPAVAVEIADTRLSVTTRDQCRYCKESRGLKEKASAIKQLLGAPAPCRGSADRSSLRRLSGVSLGPRLARQVSFLQVLERPVQLTQARSDPGPTCEGQKHETCGQPREGGAPRAARVRLQLKALIPQ